MLLTPLKSELHSWTEKLDYKKAKKMGRQRKINYFNVHSPRRGRANESSPQQNAVLDLVVQPLALRIDP